MPRRQGAAVPTVKLKRMARTTILDYLDNFQRHAREVAYVHRRGYRTQRWTYGEVPFRSRARSARHREGR